MNDFIQAWAHHQEKIDKTNSGQYCCLKDRLCYSCHEGSFEELVKKMEGNQTEGKYGSQVVMSYTYSVTYISLNTLKISLWNTWDISIPQSYNFDVQPIALIFTKAYPNIVLLAWIKGHYKKRPVEICVTSTMNVSLPPPPSLRSSLPTSLLSFLLLRMLLCSLHRKLGRNFT